MNEILYIGMVMTLYLAAFSSLLHLYNSLNYYEPEWLYSLPDWIYYILTLGGMLLIAAGEVWLFLHFIVNPLIGY